MLYESDVNDLLQEWEDRLPHQSPDYQIALGEGIYDLRCLRDKEFEEENNESFEQMIKDSAWDGYFKSLLEDGVFA
jgi:hypothetical protein